MRFLPKQSVAIVAVGIFWVGIAHAEILTRVEGVTNDTKLLKEFALGNTPCRIEEFTQHSSALSTYLADSGLNIVADKDAKCVIVYDGYVTLLHTGTPPYPLAIVEYDLLAHTPPDAAPPLLSATNASADMDKGVNARGRFDGWEAPTAGKYAAAAVGAVSALLPIGAFITAFSGAGALDAASFIQAKKNTPLGLAHVGVVIKRKDWIGYSPIIIINVYAASTATESPATLLRAAAMRLGGEVQTMGAVYNHREPQKVVSAATPPVISDTPVSAPALAPGLGDVAASAPVSVPVISDGAVSAPVAAPVVSEPAASAPLPAQVVSAATDNR